MREPIFHFYTIIQITKYGQIKRDKIERRERETEREREREIEKE